MSAILTIVGLGAAATVCLAESRRPATIDSVVERLEQTRGQVTTCVGVIKGQGDVSIRTRAEMNYANARALANGLIEGMRAALADKGDVARLPELEPRLGELVTAGTGLCATALKLLPTDDSGRGGTVGAIIGGLVGEPLAHLIDAVKELILDARARDDRRLSTLRLQLDSQRWPVFEEINKITG